MPITGNYVPAWLYHAEQGAKLFTTQAELDEAEAQGWRDSPAAVAAEIEPLPEIEVMPDDGVDAEPSPDDGVAVAKKRKR